MHQQWCKQLNLKNHFRLILLIFFFKSINILYPKVHKMFKKCDQFSSISIITIWPHHAKYPMHLTSRGRGQGEELIHYSTINVIYMIMTENGKQ